MQEREQTMGRSSLQTDSCVMQSRKKWSFSLPSFRRSSVGERQEARSHEKESAEGVARVQKAAAWQWYTRGVGDAVLPTKRPPIAKSDPPSQLPIEDKSFVHDRSKPGGDAITNNSNVLRKKSLEPALAAESSPRAASRFKAEAQPPTAGAQPTLSAPSAAPSTPLYDEFELSGLRTQMADFVQRLKLHEQTKENEQPRRAQKSKSLHVAVDGRPLPAAAASLPTDHQHTKAGPPSAAAATSCDDQLTKPPPPPSDAPVASTIPFHVKPFSALHRLFRKVASGSIIKNTKIDSSPAVYEPEVLPDDENQENTQAHHYHHYIHHHHHHYHYGESPDESTAIIRRSWRRHSESSSIRPHIPSLLQAEYDEEEEDVERSPIEAYLSRRRRHSDSFTGHLAPQKAAFDEEDQEMKEELYSAKGASPLKFQRRYNSERFPPNKIPTMVSEGAGESLERKAEGGGKSGGAAYKLGGGAADGATAAMIRRRYSEGSLQRPEGISYDMAKRTPSRYVEDVVERHFGVSAPANAAAAWPARGRDLPPIYPH